MSNRKTDYVALRLRMLRDGCGMTQDQIAQRSGEFLTRAEVAHLEDGTNDGTSYGTRRGLALAHGVHIEEMAAYMDGEIEAGTLLSRKGDILVRLDPGIAILITDIAKHDLEADVYVDACGALDEAGRLGFGAVYHPSCGDTWLDLQGGDGARDDEALGLISLHLIKKGHRVILGLDAPYEYPAWGSTDIRVVYVSPDDEPFETSVSSDSKTWASIVQGPFGMTKVDDFWLIHGDCAVLQGRPLNRVVGYHRIHGTFFLAKAKPSEFDDGPMIDMTDDDVRRALEILTPDGQLALLLRMREQAKKDNATMSAIFGIEREPDEEPS